MKTEIHDFKTSVTGRYKVLVMSGNHIVEERPFANNLVLTQGKDMILSGDQRYSSVSLACAVGTGTTPPALSDVSLGSESARTATYLTGVGNCGMLYPGGGAQTIRRTYDFPLETSPKNYTELGWSYTGTPGSNLFSRTLIAGGSVTVLADQQLRVVYDLTVDPGPKTLQAGSLTVAGWGTLPGTWAVLGTGISYTDTTGYPHSGNSASGQFEFQGVNGVMYVRPISGDFTITPLSGISGVVEIVGGIKGAASAYAPGSLTRSFSYPTYYTAGSFASNSITGFYYTSGDGAGRAVFKFDTPQQKLITHRLRINGYTSSIA